MRRCDTCSRIVRRVPFGAWILLALFLFSPALYSQSSFYFRAVNLAPGLTGLDVHFNNLAAPTVTGVQFGFASQSVSYPAATGTFNVKVAPTGQGLAGAFGNADVTAQSGYEYVGLAYGSSGGRKFKVLERNRTQPPVPDRTRVRVMNAIEAGIEIDVHLEQAGGSPLFAGVMPDQVTTTLNLPAEATTLVVTEKGKTAPLAQVTAPLAGTPYVTLIVTGTDRNNVKVYAMSDAESLQTQLIVLEQASYTNIRVVHLRPRAGSLQGDSLDIYFNKATQPDMKVTDTLRYRYASRGYGPIFADSFRVKFVPAGESPGTTVLSLDHRLGNDTSYVVVLTEFQDLRPTSLILTRTPVEPLPGLSSKIRFANASAFYGPITLVVDYGGDTMRFEDVAFKSATEFRDISPGATISIRAYRTGSSEPFFTGTPQVVPAASYMTLIAFGNEQAFLIDALNESQTGRQPLMAFGPMSGAVPSDKEAPGVSLTGVPNPASAHARFRFSLENPDRVRVELYDVMGRMVTSTSEARVEAGDAEIGLDLAPLPAGVYTCVLRSSEGGIGTTKIVVTR